MPSVLEDRAWLGRVLGPAGDVLGAAFAISANRLLTCAHVVQNAGAMTPGDAIRVDFPMLKASCEAIVAEEGWEVGDGTAGDVAVLRLHSPPRDIRAAPVRALYSVNGAPFTAYGFPAGYDKEGIAADGRLGMSTGRQWVKLDVESHVSVQRGFSGGAVWNTDGQDNQAVVAMMVARDVPTGGKVAFAIPIQTLIRLFSPLDLDPDTETHWGPRSRGVNPDLATDSWLFTGRQRALSDLRVWLQNDQGSQMRVVTGAPGTGKSALLGRLVTTADHHYRTRIPRLDDSDPAVVGSIDVTFHARDRTVREFAAHVAALRNLSLETLESHALISAVTKAGDRAIIVVDALDESREPAALCRLLDALSQRGYRVLAGCREHLLASLRDNDPLRLDGPPYLQPGDIETYVARLLQDDDFDTAADSALVTEISEAADGNFLVAQLVAHAIALDDAVTRPFPRDVAQAFDRLLHALPDPRTARELLLTLAYAQGDGLPTNLWSAAASALTRPYYPADIDELLRGPAASFLITRQQHPDGARHRLFHAALAQTLAGPRDRARDHALIWNTWTAELSGTARTRWADAPAYLLTHGAEHAPTAQALERLVTDTSYLLRADLSRLVIQVLRSDRTPHRRLAEVAAVLRLAATRLQPMSAEERAGLLGLAAHHLGLHKLAAEALCLAPSGFHPCWAQRLGATHQPLIGHSSTVEAVAVGTLHRHAIIASASADHTVRIWDADTGQALGEPLTGHARSVDAVAIGPVNGRTTIASASLDHTVRIWDAASGQARGKPLTGHTNFVIAVAIGTVGGHTIIASGSWDQTVRIWDATSGQAIGEPLTDHTSAVAAVAIGTVDGREIIVSASWDHTVRIWDATTRQAIGAPLTGHTDRVEAVAIGTMADRTIIVSASRDHTVRIWDAKSRQAIGEPLFGHKSVVSGLALGTVDGRTIIATASWDQTVRVWDAASGQAVGEPLTGHTRMVNAVAIGSVSGDVIIASAGSDNVVRIWDAVSDRPIGALPAHTGTVNDLAIGTAAGRAIIASASNDETVRVWDADAGDSLGDPLQHHASYVKGVAIGTIDGHAVIVSAGWDGKIWVSDAESGRAVGRPLRNRSPYMNGVAIGTAGDRTIIACAGGDKKVRVWDAVTRRAIGKPIAGHANMVTAVAVGASGARDIIVSGSTDATVRIWDAITGESISEPLADHTSGVSSVAIGTLDGHPIIASASWDHTVRLWDADSGESIGDPLTGHTTELSSVAIGTVDGRAIIIASAIWDHTVRVWDARTHRIVQVIQMLATPLALALDAAGALYVATGIAISRFEPAFEQRP
jgi:WD40 repeat protein